MRPLTPVSVRNRKPGGARQEIADAGCKGLYLVVQPTGVKSWALRYRFAGKPKKLTLGPVYLGSDEPNEPVIDQALTLAGARKLAGEAALHVAKGIDPAKLKRQAQQAARLRAENSEILDRDTVEAVARLYIERYAKAKTKERSWVETARLIGLKPDPADPTKLVLTENQRKDRKVVGNWVLSRWRARPIREISRSDVHDLLDEIIAEGSPVAANRVLAAIRKMFAWAASRDIIASSPCLGVSPPTGETSRDRVLMDDELRLIWRGADAIGWPFGPLTKLLMLTLQRRTEVAEINRSELRPQDLWVIPKERVKNGEEHEVPLSAGAVEVFEGLPKIGKSGLIFTVTGDTPISGFSRAKRRLDAEILKLQKADAVENGDDPEEVEPIPHWTLHDLRRTGASGMARLGIQLPVIEKVLNHSSGSFRGVVGIYQRHSFADEKRAALTAWANYIAATVSGSHPANVVTLKQWGSERT